MVLRDAAFMERAWAAGQAVCLSGHGNFADEFINPEDVAALALIERDGLVVAVDFAGRNPFPRNVEDFQRLASRVLHADIQAALGDADFLGRQGVHYGFRTRLGGSRNRDHSAPHQRKQRGKKNFMYGRNRHS